MNPVVTIARASVTEHVRRKLVIFFLALALLAGAGLIYVSLNDDLSSTVQGAAVGLATVLSVTLLQGMATLAAVAVSMNNIGRPFADGEAMLVLARPVARWQYALGRLLASVALVAALCLVIATLLQGVNLIEDRNLGAELWGHWAAQAFNLTLLVAITTLMSALFNNPVLAAFVAFFVYASSSFVSTLYLFVHTGRIGGAARVIITLLWYLTPKTMLSPLALDRLERGGDLSGASSMLLISSTGARIAWAIAYLVVTLGLTFFAVQRKEL
ncbi:MAG TPA: ABC transporter permease subunit [Actinomycetota bacterium]|nr:ABC transporter permease subunit [Actinomycetota bacterium]